MKSGFMNESDDLGWLKTTHLNGVSLPGKWEGFRSFILQGNEDSPHAVNLYISIDPNYCDDYFRVRFVNDSGVYAEACEYSGRTDKPLGGLNPIP